VSAIDKVSYSDALEFVAQHVEPGGSQIDALSYQLRKRVKRSVRLLPQRRWPAGVDLLNPTDPLHEKGLQYLERRGVTLQQIRQYQLGFGRSGRFKDYVVFPVHMDRTLVYYQGRATWDSPAGLSKAERKKWEEETGYRKSLNALSEEPYADADEVVYGYDDCLASEIVTIVEGPFDRVKVGAHCLALLGKSMSAIKAERLRRLPARRYILYLDPEVPQESIQEMAAELQTSGEVFRAVAPAQRDPGALSPSENQFCLERAVPIDWGMHFSLQ
jgi:hypothetical protein